MLDFVTLSTQHCQPLTASSTLMVIPTIESYLSILPQWQAAFDYKSIQRDIRFKNHHHLMAFLNALAYISHQQDHYAKVTYDYQNVQLTLTSKDAKGVTLNDMIMAARIEQLLANG